MEELKPFVFRRYLDYTAFDGLREMKRLIDAEVARRELADHVKLGPGGIREIEFMVQLVQLVRGGREPALRAPALQPALAAAAAAGHLDPELAGTLLAAYRFLRRVENRLQMRRDEQVHALPEDALRARAPRRGARLCRLRRPAGGARRASRAGGRGLREHARWRARRGPGVRRGPRLGDGMAGAGRGRGARRRQRRSARPGRRCALTPTPCATRHACARAWTACCRSCWPRRRWQRNPIPRLRARWPCCARSPAVRPTWPCSTSSAARASACSRSAPRSAFLAGRVTAHPLLLDDLLDTRVGRALPDAAALAAELAQRLAAADGDAEEEFGALHELKQSTLFRLGLAWLDGRIAADELSMRLAALADVIVHQVLALALRDTAAAHGRIAPDRDGLLVLGYGSLGGAELGFASDLDLVFVYDAGLAAAASDGARPLEGTRWFARVAQRVVHWLTTPARAGRLYEADTRLRPDGSKGLLVTSLDAYAEYQRERAWLWEHQALVRARDLRRRHARRTLCHGARAGAGAGARSGGAARRGGLDARALEDATGSLRRGAVRPQAGRGGLVDLEFLVQARVLEAAARHPGVVEGTRTPALLRLLSTAQFFDPATTESLVAAHDALLGQALACTLDDAPRVVPRTPELAAHAGRVLAAAAACGLDFPHSAPALRSRDRGGPRPPPSGCRLKHSVELAVTRMLAVPHSRCPAAPARREGLGLAL